MFFRYGNYQHDDNEVQLVVAVRPQEDQDGEVFGLKHSWKIRGELQASTQAALDVAIAALEAAYSVNGRGDIGLYFDNGTPTQHFIRNSSTFGGIRVKGVRYPDGAGAEYSTFRSYEIEIEAEEKIKNPDAIEFSEVVTISGGGPRFVFLQPLNGPPIKQQVAQATTFKAVQSGRAVGLLGYPSPPPPLFPAHEHRDQRQATKENPDLGGGKKVSFPVTWQYYFESVVPLIGNPHSVV